MTLALLFPGQGSQSVGMGAALADAFASAREVYAEIDEALGQKLSVLMREGPEDQLTLTENAQPALMAVSLAAARVLKVEFDQPNPAPDLDVFCEALGMTLEHYSPEVDLGVPDGGFLYADMPGLALNRPEANRTLGKFLDAGHFDGRVLVLHALYDHAALRAAYAAGRELGATHLVFTHCDELAHWGKLMDYLIDGELTKSNCRLFNNL